MNQEITYHEFFVMFPQRLPEKCNGYTKIIAENINEAALVVASKYGLDYSRLYEADKFPKYDEIREFYPNGETETFAVVNHGRKRFVLHSGQLSNREVVFDCEHLSTEIQVNAGHAKSDVFWIYELTGAHDGEPLKIAVKNLHTDYDTYGRCAANDGYFWADDLSPLDYLILDWYDGILGETIEKDYFESE